jgi:hypothetical protein
MLGEVTIEVLARPDADEGENVELARQVRHELLGLGEIENVHSRLTPAGPGTKAVGGIDWQTLIVTLAASGGVLTTLISAVQAVLSRHSQAPLRQSLGRVTAHPHATEQETTTAFTEIINRARRNGAVVSNHLSDRARDISIPRGSREVQQRVRARLRELGGHVIDERDAVGGPHCHVDY